MEKSEWLRIAQSEGFDSIEDYVKSHLTHLPYEKIRLFYQFFGDRRA